MIAPRSAPAGAGGLVRNLDHSIHATHTMRRIRLDGRNGRANSDQTKTRWSPSGLAVRDRHSQDRASPSLPDGMGIGDDKLMEIAAELEPRLGGESVELPDGRQQIVAPKVQDLHCGALGDLDQPNERRRRDLPPPCLDRSPPTPWTPSRPAGARPSGAKAVSGPTAVRDLVNRKPGSTGQVTSRTVARVRLAERAATCSRQLH